MHYNVNGLISGKFHEDLKVTLYRCISMYDLVKVLKVCTTFARIP